MESSDATLLSVSVCLSHWQFDNESACYRRSMKVFILMLTFEHPQKLKEDAFDVSPGLERPVNWCTWNVPDAITVLRNKVPLHSLTTPKEVYTYTWRKLPDPIGDRYCWIDVAPCPSTGEHDRLFLVLSVPPLLHRSSLLLLLSQCSATYASVPPASRTERPHLLRMRMTRPRAPENSHIGQRFFLYLKGRQKTKVTTSPYRAMHLHQDRRTRTGLGMARRRLSTRVLTNGQLALHPHLLEKKSKTENCQLPGIGEERVEAQRCKSATNTYNG